MDNKRIEEKAKIEIKVISQIIFELYFYENEVGDNSKLSNSISKILKEFDVNKDTDLWKKSWRMYYDWVHFTNWRNIKNEKLKLINKEKTNIVDNEDMPDYESWQFEEESDDLPF